MLIEQLLAKSLPNKREEKREASRGWVLLKRGSYDFWFQGDSRFFIHNTLQMGLVKYFYCLKVIVFI